MRTIKRSSAFKQDYKRIKATPRHKKDLDEIFIPLLTALLNDAPLPEKNLDHPLTGNYSGYRECHLKPDLLLIYQKSNTHILKLVRLGSHSELFR